MSEVTNDKLFELVDKTRLEIKGDILRVDGKVDALISGRLTTVENDISDLKVKGATLDVKVVALVAIVSMVSSGIIYALAAKVLHP